MVSARTDLADFQKPFAHEHAPVSSFVAAVEAIKPTGIIGVSTVPKLFNQAVIEAMARINERPIIFPVFQSDLAFGMHGGGGLQMVRRARHLRQRQPVSAGRDRGQAFVPGQGNNVYIFPAMGMAVLATEAKRVTEAMFIVAAKAVAEQVTEGNLAVGLIYPPTSNILDASLHTAARIAEYIFDHDLAGVPRPADIKAHVRAQAYRPVYPAAVLHSAGV